MRFCREISLAVILLSLVTFSLRAQELPSLPKASDAVTGTLPNGIQYYLVKNTVSSGFADFALVQKGLVSEDVSRGALTNLIHFQNTSPYQYLAKLGVGYQKHGYVRSEGVSTIYDFKNVPVTQAAVRDTVLLMLFDISMLSPEKQAIVIAGDIDQSAVKQRMDVFSMMVTQRTTPPNQDNGKLEQKEGTGFGMHNTRSKDVVSIAMDFFSERTPKAQMGSVLPRVSEMFARELGFVASSRIEDTFRRQGIAIADCGYEYNGSSDGPGPERSRFYVTVGVEDAERATELLGRILAEIKAGNVSLKEFQNAKGHQLAEVTAGAKTLQNGEWVRRCVSAYLYGSDLASPTAVAEFFEKRSIEASRELDLFNDFQKALLSGPREMLLSYYNPLLPSYEIASDVLVPLFDKGWKAGEEKQEIGVFTVNQSDTLSLSMGKSKSKLKSIATEPVTGGEMWTFANGMKVIFKKGGTKGRFDFGFMVNGGLGEVRGLARGEGAYIADMLALDNVAGFSYTGFAGMLKSNGIEMRTEVSPTHLGLVGSAPSSRFDLVLKSLVAIANKRKPDVAAFEYYRECEKLRLLLEEKDDTGITAALDSLSYPNNIFSQDRRAEALDNDIQKRAEEYFAGRFSHCDDGVFVIVGDLDPYMLKREFQNYIGNFHTAGSYSLRPQNGAQLRTGWSTYTLAAEESSIGDGRPGLYIAMTANIPFSADKYMAFRVASVELRRRIAEALAETGMYAEVQERMELYPSEQFKVTVFCKPADERGLPLDLKDDDVLQVLASVREAMSELSSAPAPNAVIEAAKTALNSEFKTNVGDPAMLVQSAMFRYSVGKDLVSGYADKVKAVKNSDVKDILSALVDGCRIEYVMY